MLASSPTRQRVAPMVASLLSVLIIVPAACGQGTTWPRQFESTSGTFIVYQPQPEELSGTMVTARAAFSLQKPGATAPTFGVLWFQAQVQVDRDSSTAVESNLDVTLVRLPGATPIEAKRYEHLVEAEATGWDLSGSYDELQSGLAASAKEWGSIENLDHTAPRILFSTKRALLVSYDGQPQLEVIEGSRLQRVANTPCAVVFDGVGGNYYLNGANLWYRASNPLGPWSPIGSPPPDIAAIVPPDTSSSDQVAGVPPDVITATEPSELIVTDGEPMLEPLVGSRLFYVSNTESDVLRDAKTQTVYVLISGRWFSAHTLTDPWVYVPADQLPDVFKQIPADSPKGNLLASIGGTDEADNALADNQIPQTSLISRDDHGIDVEWDGPPQFEAISGTHLQYGVNTDAQVLLADGRYYLCSQGVWYVSDAPTGPWVVSDVRPVGLDDLEPSCPEYNLRFVDIYDSGPDAVEVGYLPGYLGYYPCRGTVVYGTGYRYRPWRGRRHYYPRPCTWGFHARYNPWMSRWSFGVSYWSGFWRVGFHWGTHTGPARRHETPLWLGPGGFHRSYVADDHSMLRTRPNRERPRPGGEFSPLNLYARAENMARSAVSGQKPARSLVIGAGHQAPLPNDVYAGSDGKVYQRGGGGQWKVNDGRKWVPTPMPSAPALPVVPAGGHGQGMAGGRRGQPSPLPIQPGVQPEQQPTRQPFPGRQPADPANPPARPANPPVTEPIRQQFPVRQEPPQQQRMPQQAPVQRVIVPPVIQPTPGALERDFHARERTTFQRPAMAPHAPAAPAAPAAPPPQQPQRGKPGKEPARKEAPPERQKDK